MRLNFIYQDIEEPQLEMAVNHYVLMMIQNNIIIIIQLIQDAINALKIVLNVIIFQLQQMDIVLFVKRDII